MGFGNGKAWNQKFPYAPNEDAGDNHRGLLTAPLYRAIKGFKEHVNNIITLDNAAASNIFSAVANNHLAQNASYDGATGQWHPYVLGQPASILATEPTRAIWYYQAIATDPIIWTASTVIYGPDSGWLDLGSYGANWSSYLTTDDFKAQYRKFPDGMVLLRGLVKKSVALVYTDTIATLPVGFRPTAARNHIYGQANSANNQTDLRISGAGTIFLAAGGSNIWISLDGISFFAEN